MLRPFTRLVAIYAIVRWLKPRWIQLAVLIVSLFFISYSHSEYVKYVEVTKDRTYLAFSYQLKYALTLIVLIGSFISLRFGSIKTTTSAKAEDSIAEIVDPDRDDGFDFLRVKKNLDNRSDKLLKK